MVQWKMSADEARRRLALVEAALRNPDVRNREQLVEVRAKLAMMLELMATEAAPRAETPKPRLTDGQVRAMLARVNADLPKEQDPDKASDLRILRMKLESLQEIRRLNEAHAVECAPPGTTIH